MPTEPDPRPRRHEYPHALRVICVQKHLRGNGYGTIAKMLNVSKSSVRNIVLYYKKHGHSVLTPRTGRPRRTDVRMVRRILRVVEANRFICGYFSCIRGKTDIAEYNPGQDSADRLTRSFSSEEPYLSRIHKKKRLAYAKKYKDMTADAWENVLFTVVEMHGKSGYVSVWRRTQEAFNPKCALPTFKSSRKSVMNWSSICEYYRYILRSEIPITKALNGLPDATLLVHNNAPAHSAKIIQKCLKELNLKTLGHPPQSPDLNPIENIWAILKWELNKAPRNSVDELIKDLPRLGSQIKDEKTIRTMPMRLDAIKKARGGHTKY
ncbi:LOW QUALITY PROTEIN: Transposase [Phytophthora megakarya]|uniref:Transposase n=1 Tax=Phytophthora megakarya TaxID=4795 RepID=A0A225W2S3_9STRA|nr:LOW QUALITY PROTEIN: Transposase [Phytophthora megakarya]